MPWFKVDDSFHSHPKVAVLESGPCFAEAIALWSLAGSWCAEHLTDGALPAAQLRRLVPFKSERAAAELVRVGLWDRTEAGYQFHDWPEYQPSAESVKANRAETARRVKQYRERKRNVVTSDVTNALPPQARNASETLPPTRPDPTHTRERASLSPSRAPDPAPAPAPRMVSPDGARAEALRRGYLERWERHTPGVHADGCAYPGAGGPWLELARLMTDAQVTPFLDAFFADQEPFVSKDRSPSKLLSQRARLLTHGPSAAPQARAVARVEPTPNEEFRARVEAIAGKGATCAIRDV